MAIYACIDNYKMIIFDFDKTILNINTNDHNIQVIDVHKRDLHYDVSDVDFFRKLIKTIVDNNIIIGIASFNTYDIIIAYMKLIFGNDQLYFNKHNIATPNPLPYSKVKLIQSIQKVNNEDILYIDDDHSNILEVKNSGYNTFHVQGLTRRKFVKFCRDMIPEDDQLIWIIKNKLNDDEIHKLANKNNISLHIDGKLKSIDILIADILINKKLI